MARAAIFVWLLLSHHIAPSECQTGIVEVLENDEAFEQKIMQSPDVWSVLFTSKARHEECEHIQQRFEMLSATRSDTYRFATADVDDVKAFSSEFNVRKRMVPRLLLFASRARLAEIVKVDAKTVSIADLEAAMASMVTENPRADARIQKVTLAIGGGEEKQEL